MCAASGSGIGPSRQHKEQEAGLEEFFHGLRTIDPLGYERKSESKVKYPECFVPVGGAEGDRTPDLLIANDKDSNFLGFSRLAACCSTLRKSPIYRIFEIV
ncbi:hypothetical protein RSO01_84540 [Reyranella soli]|uniref:Uncharacterized protein n=1 Tax=Reyranella soli TaxID=1230389 RepID=A0A512NQR2_9HYPH|nr:hypothetical protein RSO01_84540 [Reyranella soli]